jgi:hypothetical protein
MCLERVAINSKHFRWGDKRKNKRRVREPMQMQMQLRLELRATFDELLGGKLVEFMVDVGRNCWEFQRNLVKF